MEDGVSPRDGNFAATFTSTLATLRQISGWDIFSGVSSSNINITSFTERNGLLFATTSSLTNTYFTVFKHLALTELARCCGDLGHDPFANSVERLLHNSKLSTIVKLPFLVEHRDFGRSRSGQSPIEYMLELNSIEYHEEQLLGRADAALGRVRRERRDIKLAPILTVKDRRAMLSSAEKLKLHDSQSYGCSEDFCEL